MGKADIIKAVKANKPNELPLPSLDFPSSNGQSLPSLFEERLLAGGGEFFFAKSRVEAETYIQSRIKAGEYKYIAGALKSLNTFDLASIQDPHELELLNLSVFEGELGVAENGAIWLSEDRLIHRAAPFITQHLILLIREDQLVDKMHAAYAALRYHDYGHGVFIAGPSKTADIEQSLVVGAHGPKSLLVVMLPTEA
ncbi:LUD domain-containing protein [Porifericola rhodea]|uniref:LutC/YkgG family protein n=1 Tax=Porifericola rhodea TaxID=930972 RepID=UPI002665365F|nr:LUD domain-containing protein [Porifericola rhodea]WKN33307.1 LUD domain-containing protein [Porifericola rhodea]